MKQATAVLFISCLLLAGKSACQGATFQAELVDSKNASNVVGTVEATVDGDEWTWSMEITSPVIAAEIADRRGSATDPLFRPLVTLISDVETQGMVDGKFGSKDVMTENAPDLYKNASIPAGQATGGHMCMGHIFAVANGTDGEVYTGAMKFTGEGDCYDATGTMPVGSKGHGGDMGMDMGMDMDMDGDAMGGDVMGTSGSRMLIGSFPVKIASAVAAIAACI